MREMENIEYSFVAKELSQLEGKHFSKAYSLGGNSFRIKIGNAHIIIEPPVRAGIAKYLKKGGEPAGFAEKLRKVLDNQRLLRVYQLGNDRLLCFEFEKNTLIAEMFAKGNIIVIGKDGNIIEVMREEKWKGRALKKGEAYKPPPSQFAADVKSSLSEKYAIVCLLKLPLGKEYAKEMLARCGIDEKRAGNSLSKEEVACLEKEHASMLRNQKPMLFLESGKPVDYGLTKFKKYEDEKAKVEAKEMPTLSEAMEEYYSSFSAQGKSERMKKLERRLAEQLASMERLKAEEKELKEKGDFIYSNYEKVEELLRIAKSAGINNVHEALKKYSVLSVNREKKEVEVEL